MGNLALFFRRSSDGISRIWGSFYKSREFDLRSSDGILFFWGGSSLEQQHDLDLPHQKAPIRWKGDPSFFKSADFKKWIVGRGSEVKSPPILKSADLRTPQLQNTPPISKSADVRTRLRAVRVITGQILFGTFLALWVVKMTCMLSCVLSCVRKNWIYCWEGGESAKKNKMSPQNLTSPFLTLDISENPIIRAEYHHVFHSSRINVFVSKT